MSTRDAVVLLKVIVGVLLAAHGLVHLLYFVTSAVDPGWPFSVERSWILPVAVRRTVALVLIAMTVAAFVLLGLAVVGVPGLSAVWPGLAAVGAVASLITLLLYWNAQLIAGIAIDIAVLTLVISRPDWTTQLVG
jgi:hypothetical protein